MQAISLSAKEVFHSLLNDFLVDRRRRRSVLEHYLITVIPNGPDSKRKKSMPRDRGTSDIIYQIAVGFKPNMEILREKGRRKAWRVEIVPNIRSNRTVPKKM